MDSLRSVIARIKPILAAAGVEYAHSTATARRGFRDWTRGIVVRGPYMDGFQIASHFNSKAARAEDIAAAIAACRAAGWIVLDDGFILAIPPKSTKKVPHG